jgi:hypothetical protein
VSPSSTRSPTATSTFHTVPVMWASICATRRLLGPGSARHDSQRSGWNRPPVDSPMRRFRPAVDGTASVPTPS